MSDTSDPERNRLAGRIARVARVGGNLTAAAASIGTNRLFGGDEAAGARALRDALGRTRGPLMKVAQMLATIPDALPPGWAEELATLQSNAPSMGWPFVRRRMRAELGQGWEDRFASFGREAAHAASLGQVHRATLPTGETVACKLQYPDMASAVEADIGQLRTMLGVFRAAEKAVDPSRMVDEIADRLREELDYDRERRHMDLYRALLAGEPQIRVPDVVAPLCTGRLLTMGWLEGTPVTQWLGAPLETRNAIATNLFKAWWVPMTGTGVIHGDPHLGNYTVHSEGAGLNLLDFGCVRLFPARFVGGVVQLYRALRAEDMDACVAAYETWGFPRLSRELVEVLNVWARFIYAPLLDDRVRSVADGISPGEYGRKEAFKVRDLLRSHGPVTIPREFVFMDRAAIGLGAAFLHLRAELNYHRLFEASLEGFTVERLAARQTAALTQAGLPLPS
jgi:predicted unusual protein kinase regulating ubiquinone biosynthesis (AarF/ABC1/UbiB family)